MPPLLFLLLSTTTILFVPSPSYDTRACLAIVTIWQQVVEMAVVNMGTFINMQLSLWNLYSLVMLRHRNNKVRLSNTMKALLVVCSSLWAVGIIWLQLYLWNSTAWQYIPTFCICSLLTLSETRCFLTWCYIPRVPGQVGTNFLKVKY